MLSTHDLACIRGDRRLFRSLSISVEPGRLLRVEGANGTGKTSLLRLLAGLALPATGDVHWQGKPIRRQRETFAQALVYLGHLAGLKDELTPVENLRIEADLCGLAASDTAVTDALGHWGLARQARLPLRVLSAGQKRRAALARLNLSTAPLWILDEPFNALDVDAVAGLGRLIEQHLARGGLAVVTSHMDLPIAPAQLQSIRLAS